MTRGSRCAPRNRTSSAEARHPERGAQLPLPRARTSNLPRGATVKGNKHFREWATVRGRFRALPRILRVRSGGPRRNLHSFSITEETEDPKRSGGCEKIVACESQVVI